MMKQFLILITLLFATTAQAGVFAKGELLTADKLNAVDATVVHKTGNETVGGAKTFTSTIIGNISGNAATTSDSTAVRLTGAQTVTGAKAFTAATFLSPWVSAEHPSFAGDLAAADAAAVAAGKRLVISSVFTTVPATLSASVKILPGGRLNGSGTVAIAGPFEGSDGCFGASQTVTGLKEAQPEWWTVNAVPGTTDMAPAINKALVASRAARLGATAYGIGSAVSVGQRKSLLGLDRNSSFIVVNFGSGSTTETNAAVQMTHGGTLSNVAFLYPTQANNATPTAFPPSIWVRDYYARITGIHLVNSYIGVRLGSTTPGPDGYSGASTFIDDVIGFPLYQGLYVVRALDVPKITNVHFNENTLWTYDGRYGYNYGTFGATLTSWVYNNGSAFLVGRCDFSHFNNLFCLGYNKGLWLITEVSGSANEIRFDQFHADLCDYPIYAQNWQGHIVFSNGTYSSNGDTAAGHHIYIAGGQKTTDKITFSNSHIYNYLLEAVKVESAVTVSFDNCLIDKFNYANGGYSAISTTLASHLNIVNSGIDFDVNGITNANSRIVVSTSTGRINMQGTKVRKSASSYVLYSPSGTVTTGNNDYTECATTTISHVGGAYNDRNIIYAIATPTAGTWRQGDRWVNNNPSVGQTKGGTCTVGGTPGTWVSDGNL